MDTDRHRSNAEDAAQPARAITTLEGALQLCAEKIASAKFAQHARRNAAGAFDLSFILQVKHHKDGYLVILDFRKKTPACPLLMIQDLM